MALNLISTVIKNLQGTIDRLVDLSMIGLGLAEKKGRRPEQEDTANYGLHDRAIMSKLNPIGIARRVWTALHCVDIDADKGGSTAAIAVYDGKDNLITAMLGDSVIFLVLYKKDGTPFAVIRLHDVLHNGNASIAECERITRCGGFIANGRVEGFLAVTRGLADTYFRDSGVTANAVMNFHSINELCKQICERKGISLEELGDIQLLVACDGLTDIISEDTVDEVNAEANDGKERRATDKDVQEYHILQELIAYNPNGKLSVAELSDKFSKRAIAAGSTDNVSVIFHELKKSTHSFDISLFDGHAGSNVSSHAARWIGVHLRRLFSLSDEEYNEEEFSVANHQEDYDADNRIAEDEFLAYLNVNNMLTDSASAEEKIDSTESENIAKAIAKLKQEQQKFFDLFLKELDFDSKCHASLKAKIDQYLENFQRMVLDAKIPLTELSKLNDAQLDLLFRHEYCALGLSNAMWSLEQIVTLLGLLESKKLTPAQSKEIFKHAFEIRCIANNHLTNSFIDPEQRNDQAFFTRWFALSEYQRNQPYAKVLLAKNLLKNECMTYRDILTFDDSLLEELNTYDAKLIRFLQITKLSIHEFIIEFNQPSLRKDFLERIDDFESFMRDCESCNRFEWRDFLNLPTDIDSSDYGYLNQVFTKIPEITKEQLFAYDEDPRQVIINYNSEIGCLMEAKLSLDEILTLDPKMRDALIDKALVFKELVNSSPHPQITKKVLLNLLSQDIRSFYLHTSTQNKNLLAKLVQLELDNSVSVVNTPATTFSPKSSKNQKEKAVADKEVSKCQCILL